jgi:aspartate/methionine/tyrosine aminotransferase
MPQFDRLNTGLGRVARLLFLNSPHNPTGAELTEKDLAELIWLAGRENILLVNDAAYAGLLHRPPASLLAIKGSKRAGVELYSFSYLFGLPRLPFGFAVGNRELISGLKRVASLMPTRFIDLAIDGIRKFPSAPLTSLRDRVKAAAASADRLASALRLETAGHPGVPYLWARIDRRTSSATFARSLLKRSRLVVAPGAGFGENGEGYVRFSLLAGAERFDEAAGRIEKRKILRARSRK